MPRVKSSTWQERFSKHENLTMPGAALVTVRIQKTAGDGQMDDARTMINQRHQGYLRHEAAEA